MLFALAKPGLFRMAMEGAPEVLLPPAPGNDHGPDWDGRPKPDHFLLLALDRLVLVGALAAVDVPGATMACWATVHGLSMLLPNPGEGVISGIAPGSSHTSGSSCERALPVV